MRQSPLRSSLLLVAAFAFTTACGSDNNGGGGTTDPGTGGRTGSGGKGGNGSGGKGSGGTSGGDSGGAGGGGSGGSGPASGGTGGGSPVDGGSGDTSGDTSTGDDSGPPPASGKDPILFGSHKFIYPAGAIRPTGTQADLDATVAAAYDRWITKFLKTGCGGFYIDGGSGTGFTSDTISFSEAHGYGMLVTVIMAGHDPKAQERYDGLLKVYRSLPSLNDPGLMAAGFTKECKGSMNLASADGPTLPDSATDGDLDAAFSMLMADRQWGSAGAVNYLAEAKKSIASIKAHEINAETSFILMGDWADIKADYYPKNYGPDSAFGKAYKNPAKHAAYFYGTRSSDFMLDHFKAFGAASSDAPFWGKVVDAHYGLIAKIQGQFSPMTGLLPGFIVAKTADMAMPAPANYLEDVSDGDWDYNACRDPWRITTDWIATGEPRAKVAVTKMNDWVKKTTGSDPAKLVDGYKLDGTTKGHDATDATFIAPFGVSAIVDASNQAWLDKVWAHIKGGDCTPNPPDSNCYFADSIGLISMIAMSGNWWQP
jgi:hypothetical protein